MKELNLNLDEMEQFIEEVFDAAAEDGCSFFGDLPPDSTCPSLNLLLTNLLSTIEDRSLDQLAVVLRASSQWSDGCPAWQPLLEATEKQGREQYSEQDVNAVLFGMI